MYENRKEQEENARRDLPATMKVSTQLTGKESNDMISQLCSAYEGDASLSY